MIAKVIVDNKSKQVDKPFDYLVPPDMEDVIGIGSRVLVPFGQANRTLEGFCMGLSETSEAENLKPVIRLANDIRAFDQDMLKVIEWMHKKYLTPYLDIIHTIVPAGTAVKSHEWIVLENETEEKSEIRKSIIAFLKANDNAVEYAALKEHIGRDIKNQVREMIANGTLRRENRQSVGVRDKKQRCVRLKVTADEAFEEIERLPKTATVQAAMLEYLAGSEYVTVTELFENAGGGTASLNTLCKKGLAEIFETVVYRDPFANRLYERSEKMTPTAEQQKAIDAINASVKSGDGKKFLLHGVTGSGKTEVFMQSIEYALSLGKTAVVLVPEISLTPQAVSRFKSRFGDNVAIFHSALSQGERYDQWKRIKMGGADIVIGARSAIFTPLKNIGIIIMDEEHSDTYKSEMSPRYHAREVAAYRATQSGAALVLASATPGIESFYKAQSGEYELLTMQKRYNNNIMPEIHIVDMRAELARGNKNMLSGRLYNEIKANLEKGEQTILFLNRRGFSSFVSCRTCGYVPECENCNISLTYHKFINRLKCHYCGFERDNYTVCPVCGSKYIRYFGGGTQRVEEEIHRLFPDATTIRMDMDTTGKKQSHEKILETFEKKKIDLLIGTQMVAKGLDFENVTLVGVITADTMLHLNDYRSAERTFALLEQVSGRAGRGSKLGRAVIQTYTPEHEAVSLVKAHDYESFYESEIPERELMWYPPYCSMIAVYFTSEDEGKTAQSSRYFAQQVGGIKEMGQKVQVLGPIPCAVSRIKNKYRYQIIFKCEDDEQLGEILAAAEMKTRENKDYEGVSIVIDKSPGMIY